MDMKGIPLATLLLLLLISIISPSHSLDANSTSTELLSFYNLVSSTVLPLTERSLGYDAINATYIFLPQLLFQNLYISTYSYYDACIAGITRCPSNLATIPYSPLTLILTRVVISLGFSVIINAKVALW